MAQIESIDSALDLVWRRASDQELLYRGWDQEYVVYNHASGDTHLLDGSAMCLLLQLQTGPLRGSALAPAVGIGGDDLVGLLADLESLSLIAPNEC